MQLNDDGQVEVRWRLGGVRGRGSSEEETAWQEEKWESEERLHKVGGVAGPIRSESAALPHFNCLIYAPGEHVGRSLVEICRRYDRSSEESKRKQSTDICQISAVKYYLLLFLTIYLGLSVPVSLMEISCLNDSATLINAD